MEVIEVLPSLIERLSQRNEEEEESETQEHPTLEDMIAVIKSSYNPVNRLEDINPFQSPQGRVAYVYKYMLFGIASFRVTLKEMSLRGFQKCRCDIPLSHPQWYVARIYMESMLFLSGVAQELTSSLWSPRMTPIWRPSFNLHLSYFWSSFEMEEHVGHIACRSKSPEFQLSLLRSRLNNEKSQRLCSVKTCEKSVIIELMIQYRWNLSESPKW